MPKNIVICCDGTNNQFGRKNTNVVRLFQSLDLSRPALQIGYYDPGVGTIAEPGAMSKIAKWWSKVLGLAFGRGLTRDIEEAYIYLMSRYEPGDQIYLFGFSRGAYTARALAGVLHVLGLLPDAHENLVPYVTKLVKAINDLEEGDKEQANEFWDTCRSFRRTFAATRSACPVRFLGVWDTVSSVGWVWEPQHFPFTAANPGVAAFRHAVSIDERRCFFRQNLWRQKNPPPNAIEMWFPGVHCDVGGGYEDGCLWVAPFAWLIREARRNGLMVDLKRYRDVLKDVPRGQPCWRGEPHKSLAGFWNVAEVFPKKAPPPECVRFGLWGWRRVPAGARLHFTAMVRIQSANMNYAPQSISAAMVEAVRTGKQPAPDQPVAQ